MTRFCGIWVFLRPLKTECVGRGGRRDSSSPQVLETKGAGRSGFPNCPISWSKASKWPNRGMGNWDKLICSQQWVIALYLRYLRAWTTHTWWGENHCLSMKVFHLTTLEDSSVRSFWTGPQCKASFSGLISEIYVSSHSQIQTLCFCDREAGQKSFKSRLPEKG